MIRFRTQISGYYLYLLQLTMFLFFFFYIGLYYIDTFHLMQTFYNRKKTVIRNVPQSNSQSANFLVGDFIFKFPVFCIQCEKTINTE